MINFTKLIDIYEQFVIQYFDPTFKLQCREEDTIDLTEKMEEGYNITRTIYLSTSKKNSCFCNENTNSDDSERILWYTFYYTYLVSKGKTSHYDFDPEAKNYSNASLILKDKMVSDGYGNF